MKNNKLFITKIFLTCLICILGILIGLFGEVIGNDLSKTLENNGIKPSSIYISLIICTILSVTFIIIYEVLNARNERTTQKQSRLTVPAKTKLHPILKFLFITILVILSIPIIIFSIFAGIFYIQNQSISQLDYYELGKSCYMSKNYDCAIKNYSEALALNPNNVYALNERGMSYLYIKEYDKAIKDFNKAIEEGYGIALNNRAIAYQQTGKLKEACADFDLVIKKKPNVMSLETFLAYSNRSYCYYSDGDYKNALKDIMDAISINPEDWSSYESRALIYDEMGKKVEAEADRKKALELKESYK